MKLTKLQMRALRIIHQQPGLTARDLAFELLRAERGGNGMQWPQAATRWGASYVARLVEQGLVGLIPNRVGWAKLELTTRGRARMDEPGSEFVVGQRVNLKVSSKRYVGGRAFIVERREVSGPRRTGVWYLVRREGEIEGKGARELLVRASEIESE